MQTLRLILSDKFIWLLTGAVALASLFPVQGSAKTVADFAFSAGIFMIFLLHGIRLERHEVIAGFRNIRLQGTIFLWVFGAMLFAAGGLSVLLADRIPVDLALGLLFIGVLPSTVQSATSYCAIARGNVAASVVASAFVNLVGVVLSPLLIALLASASGVHVGTEAIGRIMMILLLPFVLGQIIQRWARPWVMEHGALTGWMDRLAIGLAVYVSFSGAVLQGIWAQLLGQELLWLCVALLVLLIFAFGGTWNLGKAMALPLGDRKTLMFTGAQKSIAIGAPLAALIFPADRAGMILLPLLLYHLAQLIVSAPLALQLSSSEE